MEKSRFGQNILRAEAMANTQLRYARSKVVTIAEMRQNVQRTVLPKKGDVVLLWVSEDDLSISFVFFRLPAVVVLAELDAPALPDSVWEFKELVLRT